MVEKLQLKIQNNSKFKLGGIFDLSLLLDNLNFTSHAKKISKEWREDIGVIRKELFTYAHIIQKQRDEEKQVRPNAFN